MKAYVYDIFEKEVSPDAKWERQKNVFDWEFRFYPAVDAVLSVLEASQTHMSLPTECREKVLMGLLHELNDMGTIRIYDGIGKRWFEIVRLESTATEED